MTVGSDLPISPSIIDINKEGSHVDVVIDILYLNYIWEAGGKEGVTLRVIARLFEC